MKKVFLKILSLLFFTGTFVTAQTDVISLWCFDEQIGLYPSSVLENLSDNDYPLVLGLGGQIVPGKFGNALQPIELPGIKLPHGEVEFGLEKIPKQKGRKVEPLTWYNANFCALMTSGEKHLRKEIGFVQPTKTRLNLGSFDWTIEFWFKPSNKTGNDGVVFEIGSGPRGENDKITSLMLNSDLKTFILRNQPTNNIIKINSISFSVKTEWSHVSFVYSSKDRIIYHYVDGKLISSTKNVTIKPLPVGEEDYMSIGRDGSWKYPLQGTLDELRFCEGQVYTSEFNPPESFVKPSDKQIIELVKGPPLLFDKSLNSKLPFNLNSRKHLFIDDSFISEMNDVSFNVNPPKKAELVIGNIQGQFRKHLTVVEDEEGLIRIYNGIHDDYMGVRVSKDGINFESPDLGKEYRGQKNIVIHEPVGGMGNPFIDPNGSGDEKWKFISGYHSRGVYLYTSPDGFNWEREKMALIPFRSGTQSCTFYDDQRQVYVTTHRTGILHTPALATQRSTVVTETSDLYSPIQFNPLTQEDYHELDKKLPLREPLPWWLDNGPLTPGDFGLEFPNSFNPDEADPVGTDIYITKAIKYPYAPDTYLSFPIIFFHYENDGPPTRTELMNPERKLGEGPIETQIAVSRDGQNWKRYYRPAYVGIGMHEGIDMKTAYIAQGMVRRGDEIWQYYFGEPYYHSAYIKTDKRISVYRLVQRLDGFISIDSPYEKEAVVKTKPFTFEGNRLTLNIDTDAAGYAQVGFLDEYGNPVEGFSVDDCIYINGDFIETEIEWLNKGKDISSLQGKTLQLVFRMRGSKLYSMQFKNQ
ncbi:MAG: LamG-like jellyroll fold domain-containing protein [Melioribacteraceae bacterium]|nr:LamG-like jellyroll fold domain-containing protein [Melioribacteraceae bacterium]